MTIPEPRTVSMILADTLETLKANSLKITKAAIAFWILPSIPVIILSFSIFSKLPSSPPAKGTEMELARELAGPMVMMFPVAMLFSFVALWGYTVMISIAARHCEGEELTLREHAREMMEGPLWSTLAITACTAIAFFVVFLILALVLAGSPVGIFLLYLILFVLYFVVQVWLYSSVPAIIHLGGGPLFGVDQSFKLTTGYFMQTLSRYLAWMAGSGIAFFALAFIGGLVTSGVFIISTGDRSQIMEDLSTQLLLFLGYLPMLVAALFFMIFEPLYRTEIYFDLRQQHGLDEEINSPPSSATDTNSNDINQFRR